MYTFINLHTLDILNAHSDEAMLIVEGKVFQSKTALKVQIVNLRQHERIRISRQNFVLVQDVRIRENGLLLASHHQEAEIVDGHLGSIL